MKMIMRYKQPNRELDNCSYCFQLWHYMSESGSFRRRRPTFGFARISSYSQYSVGWRSSSCSISWSEDSRYRNYSRNKIGENNEY